MAEVLGIRPWELDDLTIDDFNIAVAYIDMKNKDAEGA